MERVRLGNSDLEVTRLCLGTWNMSGQAGWGPDIEEAISVVRHVLDTGCNFIDTARAYGDGRSESIVGQAVKGRREQVVIATKMMQTEPDEVAPTVAQSLQCLDTDYVDLYICHWPVKRLAMEPFFEELVKLREQGKIRTLGVSNFDRQQMAIALTYGAVSLQPPFSVVWRVPDELLTFCRENNIAVTPYSPLAQGLLTGRYTRDPAMRAGGHHERNVLFSQELWPHAMEAASAVDAVADRLGLTSAQVALAWVLNTPGITGTLLGASRPAQWDQNLEALNIELSRDDYDELDAAGRAVWDRFGREENLWAWDPG
jgi:aryl-alcohol dehydrogenase-like predicted oxidoreductase